MNKCFLSSLKLVSILAVLLGCTKERPIEKFPDSDEFILKKQDFIGLNNDSYWYSKVTVVHTSNSSPSRLVFTGLQSFLKIGFFEFEDDQLRFYDAVTDHALKRGASKDVTGDGELIQNNLINTWPINHIDFRLSVVDGKTTNKEEIDQYTPREKRGFFKIRWNEASISEAKFFPIQWDFSNRAKCYGKLRSHLKNNSLEVLKDYIEFIIAVEYELTEECVRERPSDPKVITVYYKYSFLKYKKNPSFQSFELSTTLEKGHIDPIHEKYGLFTTKVPYLDEYNIKRSREFLNLWDNKDHIFYFAPDFPNDLKWVFNHPEKGIIQRVNSLFRGAEQETGLKLPRFLVKENTGEQDLGDLRYSILKIVKNESPLLGYGPSDVDPLTGEVISANTFIWAKNFEHFLRVLRDHIVKYTSSESLNQSPLIKGIYENIMSMRGVIPRKQEISYFDEISNFIQGKSLTLHQKPEFNFLMNQLNFFGPSKSLFLESPPVRPKEDLFKDDHRLSEYQFNSMVDKGLEYLNHQQNQRINNKDPYDRQGPSNRNVIFFFNENYLLSGGLYFLKKDVNLEDYSDKELLGQAIYNLSGHEFGHNLQLAHNFMGSVDKINFHSSTSFSSSLMEYNNVVSNFFHDDFDYGAYDKAALSHAYSYGKYEQSEKEFLFCSHPNLLNILCNMNDSGSTISEIMLNHIISYDMSYYLNHFRFFREYWHPSNHKWRSIPKLLETKLFFVASAVGLTEEKLNSIIPKNSDDDANNPLVTSFLEDVNFSNHLGVAFLKSIIDLEKGDRHFEDISDERTGLPISTGIELDKLIASAILMGPHTWKYGLNASISDFLDLGYISSKDLGIQSLLKDTFSILSRDVQTSSNVNFSMRAKVMLAETAYYYYLNHDDKKLIDKMKVECFGIDTINALAEIAEKTGQKDSFFSLIKERSNNGGEPFVEEYGKIIVIRIGNQYFFSHSIENPYSYALMKRLNDSHRLIFHEETVNEMEKYLNFLYIFYTIRILKRDATC